MPPNDADAVVEEQVPPNLVASPGSPIPPSACVAQPLEVRCAPVPRQEPVNPDEPFKEPEEPFTWNLNLSKSCGSARAVSDSTPKNGIKADLDEYATLTAKINAGKKQLAEWEQRRDAIAAKLEERVGVTEEANRLPRAVQDSVDLMAKSGGAVSAKQVAAALKITTSAVYLRFNRLVTLGLAARQAHGQYVLTQKGKDSAS
jgi:hypothetical protein